MAYASLENVRIISNKQKKNVRTGPLKIHKYIYKYPHWNISRLTHLAHLQWNEKVPEKIQMSAALIEL